MTDANETRYVDPDTWFERLYAEPVATEGPAEPDIPVDLVKGAQGDKASGPGAAHGPSGWWRRNQAQAQQQPEANGSSQEPPFDLRALADHLTSVLSETQEERERRRRDEHEARHADAGETALERRQRHRTEHADRQRRASMLPLVHHSERARRFRRWVVLTGLSASVGYTFDLVQIAAGLPPSVAGGALGGCWLLDRAMRGGGRIRVSEVHGVIPLALLVFVRVPFASVLVALLGLAPLLALTNHH